MIDFIPLEYYYDIYINISLFLVMANMLHAYTVDLNSQKNLNFLNVAGYFILFFLILYIGLRPVSGRYFVDMAIYNIQFNNYSFGAKVTTTKDIYFEYFMKFLSNFMTSHGFFLLMSFLYIFPLYLISKKYFKQYWFYSFLILIVSFSFYSYGTNGIRNGVATSLFILGLCFPKNKIKISIYFILAVLIHKSMMLPIAAYALTSVYNNPRTYIKAWVLSIPVSLAMGSVFISIFSSLGFDSRLAGYISGQGELDDVIQVGFRWDFIFYSFFGVFAGWYFIVKKGFHDTLYFKILNMYLICNSFWILVIRANFSNRFAYLSWFIMGFIIIYPLLKQQFFKNQQLIIAKVIFAYFMFTYLMNVIYYGIIKPYQEKQKMQDPHNIAYNLIATESNLYLDSDYLGLKIPPNIFPNYSKNLEIKIT
ncbi:EpsG family protein [Mariniflexile aquimaris]|uniref:EpsG family protein n=1 Tax=Mariniflexile aquimaris TaxID=881009 RepID=A0ABW3BUT4_9FLAO